MKNGEFYGAILGGLNRNISYISLKNIIDDQGLDRSDAMELVDGLCRNGLARKINDMEYELICDIGQLRDFVAEKQLESTPTEAKGEYSADAEKPISLEDIAGASWSYKEAEKKEEDSVFNRFRRRRQERERRLSVFDDDDDDKSDVSKEEISREFKSFIMEMPTYDKETDTFEPEMRVYFPGGKTHLVLGYGIDDDDDLFLTDKGAMFRFLQSKLPFPEDECSLDLANQLLSRLARSSSFMKEDQEIINFVTGSSGMEYLRKEIDYYYLQYGPFLSSISWLVGLDSVSGEDYKAMLSQRINEFIGKCESGEISLIQTNDSTPMSKAIINHLVKIDPRITKDEAIEAAMLLKSRVSGNDKLKAAVPFVDSAINMLQAYSISTFNSIKMGMYK